MLDRMVNYEPPSLDTTFAALSDPTRRAILARLAQGPATVSELAQPFAISLPAISKHLRALERAGLLIRQKKGRTQHCRLQATPLSEAATWLARYAQFWEGQFAALDDFLKQPTDGNSS
jgi:DNA-binding transcriptional ArsR family regulator